MHWFAFLQLKSTNPQRRAQAVDQISSWSAPRSSEALLSALGDPAPEVRMAAAKGLGQRKEQRALSQLLHLLKDADAQVREAATIALQQVPHPLATQPLVECLTDPESSVRWHAAWALDTLGWQPASDSERAQLLLAFGEIESAARLGPPAILPLLTLFQDRFPFQRRKAVEALGGIPDALVIKPLLAALKDEDASVRAAALRALSKQGDPTCVNRMADLLKDHDKNVRLAATLALGSRRLKSAQLLSAAVRDREPQVRAAAAQSLGEAEPTSALPFLFGLLDDKESHVREKAAEALGDLRDSRGIRHLVLTLADEQAAVREAASAALSKIDPEWDQSDRAREALGQLRLALHRRNYQRRQAAADAIARICGIQLRETGSGPGCCRFQSAAPHLIRLLENADRDVRLGAAEALGRLGDPRAGQALLQSLADEDRWVRAAAARSLQDCHAGNTSITVGEDEGEALTNTTPLLLPS